jgi:hypothetical protein
MVHEDIGSVFLGNESIAFGIAEPLYFAFYSHYLPSQMFSLPGATPGKKNKGNDR